MKIVIAAIAALCLAGPAAAQEMKGMAMKGPPAAKSLSFKLDGKVKVPGTFTMAQLKAMPSATVSVTYAEQGKSSWKGVPLLALVTKAGTVEEKGHGYFLQHLILARGTDDYAVGIAMGEIDPKFEGKQVIVAYEKDGKPLDSLRLIIPGDSHAGRGVRDLKEITVN